MVSITEKKLCFNYVVSLGCACNTSLYLKELNLKLFSLPYDWIFSNFDMIRHTIEDDFKSFLDPELIITYKSRQAGHKLYHNRLFNHHNPKVNSSDRSYYQRCINRFKSVLDSPKKKLFIHTMYHDPHKYHRGFVDFNSDFKNVDFKLSKIEEFELFLSKITTNYSLLVIVQNPHQLEARVRKIFDKKNLMVYYLDCLGISTGKLLANPTDSLNYQKIISQFNYQLKEIG